MRQKLGLDDSAPARYFHWLEHVGQGDLGTSYHSGEPVLEELVAKLPATLLLAFAALAISLIIAIPLGVLSATHPGSWIDLVGRGFALAGASVPSFWLAFMLILVLAVWMHVLPTSGIGTPGHLILPAFTLALNQTAVTTRLMRSGLLDVLPQSYIQVAHGKGLEYWRVILNHALPNGLLPVVTIVGVQLGQLLGGAAIIETVFAWPGIGKLAVDAIYGRDYPVIQGFVLLTGTIVVGLNLLTDLTYVQLDPRVRIGKTQ
jgi:peptide/nickel transport system permease protein